MFYFILCYCNRAYRSGIIKYIIVYSYYIHYINVQAQARCHRIGQERAVKVYRLITRNSYEREMFDRCVVYVGHMQCM